MLSRKIVKVSSLEFLKFCFPGFEVKNRISELDYGKEIIFTGMMSSSNVEKLKRIPSNWIAVNGNYEKDISTRKGQLELVYGKYNRTVPMYFDEIIDVYDDADFDYCCKVYWVCGKWAYKPEVTFALFELFESTYSSTGVLLAKFFENLTIYPEYIVEASLMTFLNRTTNIDEQSVTPNYRRVLKGFNNKCEKNLTKSMDIYIRSSMGNRELKLLSLLLDLRG